MATVAALWRHPIKGHGRETLDRVTLTEGQTMPFDRRWAIAHEAARADGSEWAPCAEFSRGAKVPALMAIDATTGNGYADGVLGLELCVFDRDRVGVVRGTREGCCECL